MTVARPKRSSPFRRPRESGSKLVSEKAAVRVYTPESPIKHPTRLLADSLRELRVARAIAWRLALRDISAQYRQTLLGYVWAVLPAAIITLVWVALDHASA